MKKRILSFLLAAMMLVGTVLATGTSAEEASYSDTVGHWAEDYIAYVTEHGMMNGIGDGLFGPDDEVSRAMVVTVLHRLSGEPKPSSASTFPDLKEDWYLDAVAWGAESGIVKGYEDGTFGPDNDVSRQELVTFIGRYAEFNKLSVTGETLSNYSDINKIESWASDYFKWAVSAGLVNGVTEDTLQPTEGSTRAQFATIMTRYDTTRFNLLFNTPSGYSQWTEKEYPLVENADFYVSTTGDDSNPGTKAEPFKTFAKAKDAASAAAQNADKEIVVAFMAGEYGRLNETFTKESSGTDKAPIKYCAYGDGDVVFNNGLSIMEDQFEDITEEEKAYFSDKYEANVKKYDLSGKVTAEELANATLFSEDGICTIARYPNKKANGEDDYLSSVSTWYAWNKLKMVRHIKNRINKYHTTEGMIISGYIHGWDFYCAYSPVVSWDREEGVVELTDLVTGVGGDGDAYMAQKPLIIINVSEELDNAGEYWIDPNTMTLYVYAPNGRYDLTYFLDEFIRCEDGASNLSFVNLDFICGAGVETRGDAQRPVENGLYKHFESNSVIATATDTSHISFDLCKVSKIGANYAVYLDGHDISFTNGEVSAVKGGGIFSNAMDLYYFDNLVDNKKLIDNNHLYDLALQYRTYYHAIFSHDYGAMISHNKIHDVSHFAIEYTGINTIMEYNVMYVCNKYVPDAGTIYSGRSLTRVGNIIRYNLFYNTSMGGGFHIYLDDGEAGQTVYGNLFYGECDVNIQHSGGRETTISNNIFIRTQTPTVTIDEDGTEHLQAVNDYWDKYSDMCPDGSIVNSATFLGGLISPYFSKWPTPGSAGEELWKTTYPWLFNFDMNWETWEEHKEDGLNVVYPNNCRIADNYTFALEPEKWCYNAGDDVIRLAERYENNLILGQYDNPLFVDPSSGNYTIREDVDTSLIPVIPDIPFEQMGRY